MNGRNRLFEQVGTEQERRFWAQVDSEKAALPEFFTSGIAGLCEDRWSPPRGDSELTEEEKAEIRDLMARTRP